MGSLVPDLHTKVRRLDESKNSSDQIDHLLQALIEPQDRFCCSPLISCVYLWRLPLLFMAAVHCGQYHFPLGASVRPTQP